MCRAEAGGAELNFRLGRSSNETDALHRFGQLCDRGDHLFRQDPEAHARPLPGALSSCSWPRSFSRVSPLEFTLLTVSVCFVLFAELINTALEAVVDLVSPEYHPLAKIAKDVAAGAVLMAAVGAAVMGYLILSQYIFPLYKEALGMMGTPSEMATVVSLLAVVIVVVILKALSRKGDPSRRGTAERPCGGRLCHRHNRDPHYPGPRNLHPDHYAGGNGQPFAPSAPLSIPCGRFFWGP